MKIYKNIGINIERKIKSAIEMEVECSVSNLNVFYLINARVFNFL